MEHDIFRDPLKAFENAEKQRLEYLSKGLVSLKPSEHNVKVMCMLGKRERDYLRDLGIKDGQSGLNITEILDMPENQRFFFNDILRESLEGVITEMVRAGMIVLDIEPSHYDINTCRLILKATVVKPPTTERLTNVNLRL